MDRTPALLEMAQGGPVGDSEALIETAALALRTKRLDSREVPGGLDHVGDVDDLVEVGHRDPANGMGGDGGQDRLAYAGQVATDHRSSHAGVKQVRVLALERCHGHTELPTGDEKRGGGIVARVVVKETGEHGAIGVHAEAPSKPRGNVGGALAVREGGG